MNTLEAEEERKELEKEDREYFLEHSRLARAYRCGVGVIVVLMFSVMLTVILYNTVPSSSYGDSLLGLCVIAVMAFAIGLDVLLKLMYD